MSVILLPKQMRYQTALHSETPEPVDFVPGFPALARDWNPGNGNGIAPNCTDGNRKFPQKSPQSDWRQS